MANNPFNAKKQKAFLKLVEQGYFLKDAYSMANVSRQTVAKHIAENESFRRRLEKAESQGRLKPYAAIYKAIDEGDWQAARYWLSRRHFKMFNPESRYKLSVAQVAVIFNKMMIKAVEFVSPDKKQSFLILLENAINEVQIKACEL
jgi:hypothetical protein